eukprot:PITA_24751
MKYSYVEKLALAAVQVIQRFRHYILFRKTTILSDCNPMMYILSRQLLGGKYSKWIAILQEFDLEFKKSKSKKALVFAELLCNLPSSFNDATSEEAIVDENLFLISSSDLLYGDIIIYLQTQTYRSSTSRSEQRCIRYQAKDYVIFGDNLYCHGIDIVLRRCLTLEEKKKSSMTIIQAHVGGINLVMLRRKKNSSANEAHKKRVKAQFDKNVKSRVFSEGDLVLLYDQESDKLGAGKFKSL